MRILLWLTLGFAAVCGLGAYLLSGQWLPWLGLLCVLFLLPCVFIKKKFVRILGVCLLGAALGFLWFWRYDVTHIAPARSYDGKIVTATIEATDFSTETDYGLSANGKVELDGRSYKIRFYLDKAEQLRPGDQVSGNFSFRFTYEGGEQQPTNHPGKGILLLAYQEEAVTRLPAKEIPGKYFPCVLRNRIQNALDAAFPADTVGFARALLLGDSSLLDFETNTAFQISGIRHVIAVSGLHVSILFALVFVLTGKQRIVTAAVGIPVLLVFAAVAGFTPSVVRACLMQGLMILALLLNQEYDPPTALSFAVLTMLAVNPLTITSVSFQLSVGCMAGIFLFSEKVKNVLLRANFPNWLAASVSITVSTMSLTMPLCALYFDTVSLIGIATNLLTLWIISFVFYGIMATAVLTAIWLPLAKVLAWVISWPIRFVILTAKLLSKVPFAAVYTCSVYILVWLVLVYVLFAVFMLCRKKKPWLFTGGVAALLCLSIFFSWLEPKLDNFRLTVLDVGQGQCILYSEQGRHYMVDCGGDTDASAAQTAIQKLRSQGINHLDGVILTHYDKDHAGGIALALTQIKVDKLYLPNVEDEGKIRESLWENYGDKVMWIDGNTQLRLEDTTITLFSPITGKEKNESSICVLFQPENCDILITGDRSRTGEAALLQQAELPKLELLIAGHHGAQDAVSIMLLNSTQPDAVAISAGRNNRFGHPAKETLERIEAFGCHILRTDLYKTIVFRG